MGDKHDLIRTSPTGGPFVGTCIKCGRAGLRISDGAKYCDNPSRMTTEDVLSHVLGGGKKDA